MYTLLPMHKIGQSQHEKGGGLILRLGRILRYMPIILCNKSVWLCIWLPWLGLRQLYRNNLENNRQMKEYENNRHEMVNE